jgi:hypothetical protein
MWRAICKAHRAVDKTGLARLQRFLNHCIEKLAKNQRNMNKNLNLAWLFIGLFLSCGGIVPTDPTGFGVWSDDCAKMAVAVNRADYDNRPLMGHNTNERCDLDICDTNGIVIKTLFADRKTGGIPSVIDSLLFLNSKDTIYVYTKLYGTGTVRKERISTITGNVEQMEDMETINWPLISHYESGACNGNKITWDQSRNWIKTSK